MPMPKPLPPETPAPSLTEAKRATLSALADAVIPPSDAHRVPGAGDPAIVQAMLHDTRRRPQALLAAIDAVDALAGDALVGDEPFADLPADARAAVVSAFREAHAGLADIVAKYACQAYYRDPRVMASLGMETRPPHPTGFELKDGDWSLLEPVRRKQQLYRPAG